ncbi:MAG TPA: hypothetical protein VLX58_08945 [Bryobacteraceae bacterium]|nr:hypothetical protein [Bryobacteraceae bacterium]
MDERRKDEIERRLLAVMEAAHADYERATRHFVEANRTQARSAGRNYGEYANAKIALDVATEKYQCALKIFADFVISDIEPPEDCAACGTLRRELENAEAALLHVTQQGRVEGDDLAQRRVSEAQARLNRHRERHGGLFSKTK